MASLRAPTIPAARARLANVTYIDSSNWVVVTMLSDRRTIIGSLSDTYSIGKSQDDGATWTTIHSFATGYKVNGCLELPDGEVLVSVDGPVGGLPGEVWKSSGWNFGSSSATWTKVLTAAGTNVIFRAPWGLGQSSLAPPNSAHAGYLFVCEYGPRIAAQIAAGHAGTEAACHVYMSTDNGATWSTVFSLFDVYPGTVADLHTHDACYDPYHDRLIVVQGDGTGTGQCGIWYSDNFTSPNRTWTLVPNSQSATSTNQCTAAVATENGVVFLPDGPPFDIRVLARRGRRQWGDLTHVLHVAANTGSGITGWSAWRCPGLRPAPLLMTCSVTIADGGLPKIYYTMEGRDFYELWSEASVTAADGAGFRVVVGPTITGKVVGTLLGDGRFATHSTFQADWIEPQADAATAPYLGNTVTAWAATTIYAKGQVVTQLGSTWAAVADFTSGATFDPTNWQLIASGGFGFPATIDPVTLRSTSTDVLAVAATNACHYSRVRDGGPISKIALWVGTQSGNISVAAYRCSGSGRLAVPATRLATSGAVACPAPGYAEIALGSTVTLMPGDWLAVTADNTTATFHTLLAAAGDSSIGLGRQFRQATAHPAPSPAGTLIATWGYGFVLIGVA